MKPRAKGSQAAALWVGAVLTSFSCQWPSGPDPVDSDPRSGATTDSTDTTDATDTTDEAPDDTAAERPNLTARLVDPDGAPLGQLSASACSDVLCYVARTSGSGRLEFRVMRTGRYVLHNLSWPGAGDAQGWSSFFDFVDVVEGEPVSLFATPFVVPRLSERLAPPDGPGALRFSEGALTLTVDGSRLKAPVGVDLAAGWTIGAVDVPQPAWPTGGLDGATIVRAWAFAPFELTTEDEAGFQVRVDVDAAAGDLELRVADYADGSETGLFTRVVTTRDGNALEAQVSELTWLLVVRP